MSARRRGSDRRFYAAFLLVSLLVAAGVSYFASSHPDGLEFVAEETGFIDQGEDSPMTSSPLNDYSTTGVSSPWASGAIAGVAGVAITLAVGGSLFWVLRRKGTDAPDETPGGQADADGLTDARS